MIIVSINGGLGNQLFQYAFGKHLEHINQEDVFFDLSAFDGSNHRDFALNHFNIKIKKATQNKIPFIYRKNFKKFNLLARTLNKLFYTRPIFTQNQFHFNPYFLQKRRNAYYWGYWQSQKYFEGVKNIIKKELIFKDGASVIDQQLFQKIQEQQSVCIHVRRGDYLGHSRLAVNELSYYKKAIEAICNKVQNPSFYIFSDDIDWCKENLMINYPHTFVYTGDTYRDFRLMTQCRHNIIANSSFSWWGAYLGQNHDKIVISPKKWFVENIDKDRYNTKDLLPENWMII